MDSFSNYNSVAIGALGKWQSVTDASSVFSIVASGGRNGNSSLHMSGQPAAGSAGTFYQRTFPGATTRFIFGAAIKIDAFDTTTHELLFLQWMDASTPQISMTILPNGQIKLYKVAETLLLATSVSSVFTASNVYFFIEIDITFNAVSGAIAVHSNGVNVPLTASTGLNTAPSGNNSANTLKIGNMQPGAATPFWVADFSDLYVCDSTGAANNSFLGDVRVVCVFPNGAGASTQFTPNGAGTNWQCVNEVSEDAGTTFINDANV